MAETKKERKAAKAALKAESKRLRKRRRRIWMRAAVASSAFLTVLIGSFAVATVVSPRADAFDSSHSRAIDISVSPSDPGVFDGKVFGTDLSVGLLEERSPFQDIGFQTRTPVIRVNLNYMFQDAKLSDFEDFQWEISISDPTSAIQFLDYGQSWTDEKGRFHPMTKGWQAAPSDNVTSLSMDPYLGEWSGEDSSLVVMLMSVDLRIAAPVDSQGLTDDEWVQEWRMNWIPPETSFSWTKIGDDITDDDWQDKAAEAADRGLEGSGSFVACASCDISKVYGDIDEVSREMTVKSFDLDHAAQINLNTDWRPWSWSDPALGWIVGTLLSSLAGIWIAFALGVAVSLLADRKDQR